MTRKRFVKLMMALGYQRNEINALAKVARWLGIPYQEAFLVAVAEALGLIEEDAPSVPATTPPPDPSGTAQGRATSPTSRGGKEEGAGEEKTGGLTALLGRAGSPASPQGTPGGVTEDYPMEGAPAETQRSGRSGEVQHGVLV